MSLHGFMKRDRELREEEQLGGYSKVGIQGGYPRHIPRVVAVVTLATVPVYTSLVHRPARSLHPKGVPKIH